MLRATKFIGVAQIGRHGASRTHKGYMVLSHTVVPISLIHMPINSKFGAGGRTRTDTPFGD